MSSALKRNNLMLTESESEWLDAFAAEVLEASGCKISRSEIVRAAIAGLRELCKTRSGILSNLTVISDPSRLELLIVLAARMADTHCVCIASRSGAHQ